MDPTLIRGLDWKGRWPKRQTIREEGWKVTQECKTYKASILGLRSVVQPSTCGDTCI